MPSSALPTARHSANPAACSVVGADASTPGWPGKTEGCDRETAQSFARNADGREPQPSDFSARKTTVIINPAANKGRCGQAWPLIRARLEAVLGFPVEATVTSGRGHAMAVARAAFDDGRRRFISVGGDGTLNEIVNGLVVDDRLADPGIVFAQIPAGTSNAVARAMGHAGHGVTADAAFAALAGAATRSIDLFRVDSQSADGTARTRYGFLLATLGAPATVGLRAGAVPLLKRLGPVAYVIMAVVTALTYRPRESRISIDGAASREDRIWGAMVCSAAGAGDGLLLAPGAVIDDGLIDLVSIGALTRREALFEVIPNLADGAYVDHPKVTRRLLRCVQIETLTPVPVDVDGEPVGFSPVRVRVLPVGLQIAAAVKPSPSARQPSLERQ